MQQVSGSILLSSTNRNGTAPHSGVAFFMHRPSCRRLRAAGYNCLTIRRPGRHPRISPAFDTWLHVAHGGINQPQQLGDSECSGSFLASLRASWWARICFSGTLSISPPRPCAASRFVRRSCTSPAGVETAAGGCRSPQCRVSAVPPINQRHAPIASNCRLRAFRCRRQSQGQGIRPAHSPIFRPAAASSAACRRSSGVVAVPL